MKPEGVTEEEWKEVEQFYFDKGDDGLTDWQRYKRNNYCSFNVTA